MIERNVTIVNRLGLHARAAAKLVTHANQFKSQIKIRKGAREVSGKSIMGLMMLAAAKGTEITLLIEGPDEAEAMEGLSKLIAERFGEEA